MDNYADLMKHLSHKLEVSNYANRNAAIECVTCSEVLIDFEKGDTNDEGGKKMLGYDKNDLGQMTDAIQAVLTTVVCDDDPWLSGNLNMTLVFLQGLSAEGYFD